MDRVVSARQWRDHRPMIRPLPMMRFVLPVLALAACTGLSWFGVRLDPEVYYIDRLPVNVDGGDYALVALAAFLIDRKSVV